MCLGRLARAPQVMMTYDPQPVHPVFGYSSGSNLGIIFFFFCWFNCICFRIIDVDRFLVLFDCVVPAWNEHWRFTPIFNSLRMINSLRPLNFNFNCQVNSCLKEFQIRKTEEPLVHVPVLPPRIGTSSSPTISQSSP